MIRLLIISTQKHKELGEFLAARGAFEIVGCYSSLSTNAVDIQNNILKVDKTLYLYQDDGTPDINIRSDMQMLQCMLENNSFFVPGEIVFMTQNTHQGKQAERYFISVMEACGYSDYSVLSIDGQISFSSVYADLLGVSTANDFKNKYTTLWRAERHSDSSFAYSPKNDKNLLLEPFVFDNLKKYEEQSRVVVRTSFNVEFKDGFMPDVASVVNPNLSSLYVTDLINDNNVNIVTGKSKSGVSVWTCALAASSVYKGLSVLIMDYTSNSDIGSTFKQFGKKYTFFPMKEMLHLQTAGSGISVCGIHNDREEKIKMNFLQKIMNSKRSLWDVVLLALDTVLVPSVYPLLQRQINKVLLTTVPRHPDVVELQKFIKIFEKKNIFVILNESLDIPSVSYLTQQEVKDILIFFEPKVVKSYKFTHLDLKGGLYDSILKKQGGGCNGGNS